MTRGSTVVRIGVWAALVVLLCAGAAAAVSYTATVNGSEVTVTYEGTGTENDPYLINGTNAEMLAELQAMNSSGSRDNHFRLTADIDAAATRGWNGGVGFEPLPDWDDGGLDGANHTVADLYIANETDLFGVGLIGKVSSGIDVRDLALTNVTVRGNQTVGQSVGALVGEFGGGNVTRVQVSGNVSGHVNVGGVLGNIQDTTHLQGVQFNGSVTGEQKIGGIMGQVSFGETTAERIRISASVTASGQFGGGGAIGYVRTGGVRLDDARIDANVSADDAGGVVGILADRLDVNGTRVSGTIAGTQYAGGFVGQVQQSSGSPHITNSTGNVTSIDGDRAGGFIGQFEGNGTIRDAILTIDRLAANTSYENPVIAVATPSALEAVAVRDAVVIVENRIAGNFESNFNGSKDSTEADGDVVVNAYYNESTTSTNFSSSGAMATKSNLTVLTRGQMTGSGALANMSLLSSPAPWTTTDGFPDLDLPAVPRLTFGGDGGGSGDDGGGSGDDGGGSGDDGGGSGDDGGGSGDDGGGGDGGGDGGASGGGSAPNAVGALTIAGADAPGRIGTTMVTTLTDATEELAFGDAGGDDPLLAVGITRSSSRDVRAGIGTLTSATDAPADAAFVTGVQLRVPPRVDEATLRQLALVVPAASTPAAGLTVHAHDPATGSWRPLATERRAGENRVRLSVHPSGAGSFAVFATPVSTPTATPTPTPSVQERPPMATPPPTATPAPTPGGMLRLEPAGVDLRAVDAPQAIVAGLVVLLLVLLVRRRR